MSKGIILVTGGCGYIGSHTIVHLVEKGYQVISVDSLIHSGLNVLDRIELITNTKIQNFKLDLSKENCIEILTNEIERLDGIIHFAALKAVGESVEKPLEYYDNNLKSLINVLKLAQHYQVKAFVFSSSCTVYGNTKILPVHEELPFEHTASPYGRSKQMCEQILFDYYHSPKHSGKGISLRYFNPAGAHTSMLIGESPIEPPLNLVPIITETAIGKRKFMHVHGSDYDTRDGTCIRDYIHIMDLAEAHCLALDSILNGKQQISLEAYNLGIGEGVSVLEAIHAFEMISKIKLHYLIGPRRPGDIAAMYADNSKIRNQLDWRPKYDIESIMRDAWAWEQKRSGQLK